MPGGRIHVTATPLAGVGHLIVAFGVANNPGLSGSPYTALHVHAVDLAVDDRSQRHFFRHGCVPY